MEFDLRQCIEELSKKRPLFHNEKDFQLELAWLIKEQDQEQKKYKVRLECFFDDMENGKRSYVDIVVFDEQSKECALVELKYKTIAQSVEIDGEKYNLRNQVARDEGCYAVLSDLSRLEGKLGEKIGAYTVKQIYSCILTNDNRYKKGFRKNTLFYNFGLENGRKIEADSDIKFILNRKSFEDTCARRFHEIRLMHQYTVNWNEPPYSEYLECLILEHKV